jgi:hypothetical protein
LSNRGLYKWTHEEGFISKNPDAKLKGPFNGIKFNKAGMISLKNERSPNMGFFMAVAPVVIVGGIVVYVIERLKHKYNRGNLGKKKSKSAQNLLDSLIPLGMIFGCALGIILGMFFQISLLSTVTLGAGIGYLFGYFAYEIYSKKGNIQS